jgi:acyl carrier protein
MTQDVRKVIIESLLKHCEDEGKSLIIDDSTPMTELDLDSLALIELLYELEDEFEVTLDANELPALNHVSDLVSAIQRSRLGAD